MVTAVHVRSCVPEALGRARELSVSVKEAREVRWLLITVRW